MQAGSQEASRPRRAHQGCHERQPQILLVRACKLPLCYPPPPANQSHSGSDSAPHPIQNKTSAEKGKAPAGVFTQPFVTQLVVLALQEGIERGVLADADVTQEKLENFLSKNGRAFYKLPQATRRIVLEKKEAIPTSVKSDSVEVGNSRHGDEVFSLRWL